MQTTRTPPPAGALPRIQSAYASLAPAELRVADYVREHAERVIYLSITELAEETGVAESTVIRFCQAVGFRGYQDLKLSLARDRVSDPENIGDDLSAEDTLEQLVRKVEYHNASVLSDTARLVGLAELDRAVRVLVDARKIDFYGVGASGATALDAKYKFLRIGKLCDAFLDGHMQAMSAALLTVEDVALGISHTGSTRDVVEALERARQSGATTVCITSYARSPVTRASDITLLTASRETPLGSGALRSKIAQLFVLDLLFTAAALRLGASAWACTERTAQAVLDKLY